MEKFTFIIPTLWKSNLTISQIEYLQNCDYVDEIILIENKIKEVELNFSKLKRIQPESNLYVNPSWNLGVQNSKNEYICLLNDDILFRPTELLVEISEHLKDKNLIGVHPDSYQTYVNKFNIVEGSFIGKYWGCAIFVRKSKYVVIPEDVKIFYGDNWLCRYVGKPHSFTYPIILEKSKTSALREFQSIASKDKINYSHHIEKNKKS